MKTRRQEPPGRGEKDKRGGGSPRKGSGKGSPRESDRTSRRESGGAAKPPARGGGKQGGKPPSAKGAPLRRGREREVVPSPLLARPGRDLLYGRNAVLEALRGRRGIGRLYLADGIKEDDRVRQMMTLAVARGGEVDRVPRLLLDDATRGANHQGVALEAEAFRYMAFEELVDVSGTVLVLDHLQDPQNLGTLLRAAEAAGVAGVVIPQNRAVDVTPAVVNASSGAVEHLRIATVPNLTRALAALKQSGRWVVGLDAGEDAPDFFATEIPTPAALVVGGEGSGIGAQLRKACDLVLSLPMLGRVESLNAATAGSIALYDLLRRERGAAGAGQEAAPRPVGDNAAAHIASARRSEMDEDGA